MTAFFDVPVQESEPWANALERRRKVLFVAVAAVGVLSAPWLAGITPSKQLAILGPAIALLALPHGAVDPWLVLSAAGQRSAVRVVGFVTAYVLVVFGFVLAYLQSPTTALAAFLMLSAWHFGETEVGAGDAGPFGLVVERWTRGATPILAPLVMQPTETLGFFSSLTGAQLAGLEGTTALRAILWMWAALRLFSMTHRGVAAGRDRDRDAGLGLASEACVWLLFAALPVLLAFGVYFCLDHSLRHTLRVAHRFSPRSARRGMSTFLKRSLPVAGLACVAVVIVGSVTYDRWAAGAALELIFIGLASLTFPHALLAMPAMHRRTPR